MTETRLWNGGTQPLVPADIGWGGGVVMPGESFVTEHPESYGPPWVEDPEAEQKLREAMQALASAEQQVASAEAADGRSEPENVPQGTSDVDPTAGSNDPSTDFPSTEGQALHVNADGEVVNESGQVVGHIDVSTSGNPAA